MLDIVRRVLLSLLTASTLIGLAACAAPDAGVSVEESNDPVTIRPVDPEDPPTPVGPQGSFAEGEFPYDTAKPPQEYDQYLYAATEDVQDFWREQYPLVYGEPYPELEGGVHPGYPGKPTPIPGCGESETDYSLVEMNAFYCGLGDFVAYDDAQLFPQLARDFGPAVLGVVMAHEWGHAIQARQGLLDGSIDTVITELQADCFAGAWSAHVADGGAEGLAFGDADVVAGLNGMIFVADPVGTTSLEPGAHGSAFDRVGAFQDGFLQGAAQCATYIADPPRPIQLPFTDGELQDPNRRDPSDAPFDDVDADNPGIFTLVQDDLGRYWTAVLEANGFTFTPPALVTYSQSGPFPECPGVSDEQFPNNAFYCAATNEVMFDRDYARALYDAIGDFAIAYLIGMAWSDAVQTTLNTGYTGELRALYNDCLTGAWTQDIIPDPNREQNATISAGDLDEAVQTALAIGDVSINTDVIGSAFEKIDAYRAGVFGGIDECNARIGG
jgi:predicted metalloprotease